MQSRKQNLEKNRRTSLAIYMAIVTVVIKHFWSGNRRGK